MRKEDLMLALLKEVRLEQKEHSETLIHIRRDVERNTLDLTEHIEGVKQNRRRIEKLEAPRNAVNFIKSALLWVSGIAGAIITILRLLDKF